MYDSQNMYLVCLTSFKISCNGNIPFYSSMICFSFSEIILLRLIHADKCICCSLALTTVCRNLLTEYVALTYMFSYCEMFP